MEINNFSNRSIRRFNFRNRLSNLGYKLRGKSYGRFLGFAILGVILLGGLVWGTTIFAGFNKNSSPFDSTQKFKVKDARATQILNQEYQFPIKDDKNQEVSKIKYIIESAEIRDEIIVKGKKASSVEGRTFLVLNLKIQNDFNKPIEINTRDYIRLIINGNDKELQAADIHNDPVAIQPISTKYTRLAFPINDGDKKLKLMIGEIKGDKKPLDLDLKF